MSSSVARADDTKVACVAASTAAQTLRKEDRLLEAREKFHACAAEPCPELVRSRCTHWLTELELDIPNAIVRAKDSTGRDILDADVTIDGHPGQLGRREAMDPGEHVVVVKAPDGRTGDEKFLLVDGEHGRIVTVRMPNPPGAPPPETAAPGPTPPGGPPSTPPQAESHGGGIPSGAWVLGGIGLVGLGSFAFFFGEAASESSCSPNCSASQTQTGKTNAAIAYVSLGVGVVGLVGAVTWAIVAQPGKSAKQATYLPAVDVQPVAGGALTTFRIAF